MVESKFSCPKCGNQEEDWLIWDDDGETVTCVICKTTFRPGEPAPRPHSIILQELLYRQRREEFIQEQNERAYWAARGEL